MIYYQVEKGGGGTMVPSVIDYLLQLPEAMHFARVQELCGDGVFFYRMLSEYGKGHSSSAAKEAFLMEHGGCMIANSALSKLAQI